MRTTRKLLALLLAIAMVFAMTAITAMATGGDDTPTPPADLTTPDGGDPTTPDGDTPTTPDGGDPTTPDGGDPTTPDGDITPDGPTPPEVSEQAQTVINLIAALPEFNKLTSDEEVAAYKAQVSAAQAAYDALTEEQKAEVTNVAELTQAEDALELLGSKNPLEDVYVCEIEGGSKYASLEAAVEAVQDGETIKMLEDVALTKSVTLPDGVTLDLNGKTISGNIDTALIKTQQNADTGITITDFSSGTKGKIENGGTKAASYAVLVDYSSKLTLDGGISLRASGTSSTCGALGINVKRSQSAANIQIKNANLSAANGYPIKLSSAYGSANIEILGGSFSGDSKALDSIFIYSSGSSGESTVTVYSGTFKNWNPEDDMDKLADTSHFCIKDDGIEVKDTQPDSYNARLENSNYYLTGTNLYRLALYGDFAGKTVEIAGNVSCNYPSGEYFGENGGTPAALTLRLTEGSSLTGTMPLGIADITVEGEQLNNFFLPFDENYEITKDGNVYRCRLKTEVAVATVTFDGSTYTYTKIQDAINDAKKNKGSILKLNQDVSYANSVSALSTDAFDWTLDLNGHTYTYTGMGSGAFLLRYEGNTLNIIDNSGTEKGTIIVNEKRNYAIGTNDTSNKCKIVIGKGVTIQGNTILIEGTDNTLDVYGTIAATGDKNTAIQTNGSYTKNSTINLYDGAKVTSESCAIYHPGTGTLNVYKATVTGGGTLTGIEMRAGTLNVYEGAEITGGKGEPGSKSNGNGTTTNNAAIAVAQHSTKQPININIEGGTFTGGAAIYESNPQNNPEVDMAKVTIQIKGGTFTATYPNADSVYSQNKTGFITGGKFSTDVKEYVSNQHDQLVTNNGTATPFWVGKYTDSGAADAMGQTVYKVTYNFDDEIVDVYYLTEAEAEEAIKEAKDETVVTKDPVAVKPTSSGGGGSGSGSYRPVILSPVWNQTVSVIEHGTLTMSVRASGASSYQWYVDRGDGRGFVPIAGATGASLTIWPDMGDDGNRYYCRAMNGYGGVNSPYFTLCVVRSTLPPKTGDQVSVTLWVCLMALGVAGVLTALNRQRNR